MSRPARVRLALNGYRYFPYELTFAAREIASVLGAQPRRVADGYTVPASAADPSQVRRLTYIDRAVLPDGTVIRPDQALLEESDSASSTGRAKRQSTRYSAHGLHEYRGKFNPQVVRSIGNLIGVKPGQTVLDPFCGSGTTLLEALHVGWNAVGVDLNPLGVLIANAKIAAMEVPLDELTASRALLVAELHARSVGLEFERDWNERELEQVAGLDWRSQLPDYEYLSAWMPTPVLAQFAAILQSVARLDPSCVIVFRAIVSDLVRSASLQDPGDLRIRRRKDAAANYPVIPWFLDRTSKFVARVLRAREVVRCATTRQVAYIGDSRGPLTWLQSENPSLRVDAVITSPPYATALPYIDTQRLSLTLLGLVNSRELGSLERDVTGTREITATERVDIERRLDVGARAHDERGIVPSRILELCQRMANAVDSGNDGFRRKNTPALIYKYFGDMARSFRSVHDITRPGVIYALVVGSNRTTLGGEEFVIETPELLGKTASDNGWAVRELVPMDTYQRFGIHQANSIRSETLLILERT